MIEQAIIKLAYLTGAVMLVFGLKLLSSPKTAARGNRIAAFGMAIAIATALFEPMAQAANNYLWIIGAMLIGSIIGWLSAKKVAMTAMPQLVSIFNGLGGASAAILAMLELQDLLGLTSISAAKLSVILFTLFLGAVSFSGSILAYLKLDGKVKDSSLAIPGLQYINYAILLGIIALIAYSILNVPLHNNLLIILLIVSLLYGLSFVAPIGGADMPVVISLLNSFTGISAATAGIIYSSQIMLIGGVLVGASGTILTIIMCAAMNRSLFNVILGSFGASSSSAKSQTGTHKEISANDLAVQMYYADRVIFVPGYGLAVAQAQKVLQELDTLLSENDTEVFYAIHPVAGRMPGHMNVLLAEANVPYDKLLDLEESNEKLNDTDVVVVIGANDVVNPSALDDPSSPIYGMPVLEVWKAKKTVVLKRSMNPGYAGIQNPLFFKQNNSMFFGDAKDSIQKLIQEVKTLG